MHVVLLQNMLYVPVHGGANGSNRQVMEAMARQGHACEVVAPAFGPRAALTDADAFHHALRDRDLTATETAPGTVTTRVRDVTLHAVTPTDDRNVMSGLYAALDRVVTAETDWVLVSIDEASPALLEAAHRTCPGRVVCLAHTSTALPFGPMARVPTPAGTRLMQRCAAVLTNTRFMCDYLARHGDVDAQATAIAPFDPGPHPQFADFDDGFVTVINPCDLKGICIFLALADRFPDVAFAAVPTWGTTAEDRAALDARANVTVLPPRDDVDEIYRQTRVLLMPSLWVETLGRCATEAMQRGLPVLASDYAGLPEAKDGVEYLLPIRPIEKVSTRLSDRRRPVPETVPEQNVEPWADALRRLLSDRAHYEAVSRRSRAAGTHVAQKMKPSRVGDRLRTLTPTDETPRSSERGSAETKKDTDELSDEKRRLLALRALNRSRP